ncbi:MAG TPA: AraC family transcriptional regulator [Bryobacteraceae bacterium]|nr:AraC family transcriptional regulator [Bryobacteraceae bacterium]
MAKIAVEFEKGCGEATARPVARLLAQGDGWAVSDVVCTAGPRDRPFEEQHTRASIAMIVAGTFQYRSSAGCDLMTPGSLLLGNLGQSFECGHEHGMGDRCISFSYAPEFFERIAADAGSSAGARFQMLRVPAIRPLSPLIARAAAALAGSTGLPWEELTIELAAQAVQLERGLPSGPLRVEPGAVARVTRVVRMIERQPDGPHNLKALAGEAHLSPYHFLRTFEVVTSTTPHQHLLRIRLRHAATRISTEPAKILDIALDCGFGDISNFNRTFRAEFGVSPRVYRAQTSSKNTKPRP